LQAVDYYSKSPLDPQFDVDRNLVNVAKAMYHAWIQTGMVVTVGLCRCRHCIPVKMLLLQRSGVVPFIKTNGLCWLHVGPHTLLCKVDSC